MLLAVEGGGLFSASASGYTKVLTLLFSGHKNDDNKHMRVSPWNQFQLVDQETDTDLQLASSKNRFSRGCASFVCFSRTSAGLDGQSPLKVGPTQPQGILPNVPTIEKEKEKEVSVVADSNNNGGRNISLRSSMKKSTQNAPQIVFNNDEQEPLVRDESGHEVIKEKRKVQWTDACGKELMEIREFEMSGGSSGVSRSGRWRKKIPMFLDEFFKKNPILSYLISRSPP